MRGDDGQGVLDARMQRPPEPLVDSAAQRDQAAPEGAARLDPPTSRASQAVRTALCSALCSRISASSTACTTIEASVAVQAVLEAKIWEHNAMWSAAHAAYKALDVGGSSRAAPSGAT